MIAFKGVSTFRRIFTRNLRGLSKPTPTPTSTTTNNNNEDDVFKTIEQEVDLKSFKNLSTIARLAIEEDTDVLKSLVGDKKILSDDKKLLKKSYKLKDEYKTFRNGLLTELNQVQNNENQLNELKEEKIKQQQHELIEDTSVNKSKISCGGCGSRFQCNDQTKGGFITADLFKEMKNEDFFYKLCLRCEMLKLKQKKYLNMSSNEEEYNERVLNYILSKNERILVILLIDLLDIPNSIYAGWSKFIQNNNDKKKRKYPIEIFIVGSKLDLLPNTGPTWKQDVVDCLLKHCADKGIKGDQIKHVDLISAQNGYKIEKLIDKLFDYWDYRGDVYLLGVTNAGKSVLYNRLLASDYCHSLASEALTRASISYWPNTTLNMLKFPMTRLDERKYELRKRRLYLDRMKEREKNLERFEKFKKTHNIEDAILYGIVNTTFKPSSVVGTRLNTEIDAAYSMNESGQVIEGENYKTTNDIRKEQIKDAREKYHPGMYRDACFFHDTPGVLTNDHIFRKFSNTEALISLPKIMILPRVVWMIPGQSLLVGGVIRIDLLESTNNERILFSMMTNMRLPLIEPFNTNEAEERYEYLYRNNRLVVPFIESSARKNGERLSLKSKDFEIKCIGNYKSTTDIVFSSFGWTSVTSRPDITAKIRAYTLEDCNLDLREPPLLPYVVNMRRLYCHPNKKQLFVSRFTRVAFEKIRK